MWLLHAIALCYIHIIYLLTDDLWSTGIICSKYQINGILKPMHDQNTISSYHHWSCELKPRTWRCVLDTTLCSEVCQWLVTGRWFSPGTPVPSTYKTNRHNIDEILLKVALNTIKHDQNTRDSKVLLPLVILIQRSPIRHVSAL